MIVPAASLLPSLPQCLALTSALLVLAGLLGRGLLPGRAAPDDALARLALRLALGLLFLAGLCATWGLGRCNHLTLLPLLLTAFAFWNWSQRPASATTASSLTLPVLSLAAAVFALTWLCNTWWRGDDHASLLNMDLGYFAQLAKGLPEAKVESLWAAALGPHCQAAGENADVWYHWCPVWLTAGVSTLAARPALEVLLFVISPVLNLVLALLAGALVARLTGWAARWSLPAGAASLTALAFPAMAHPALLARFMPLGVLQHVHVSLAYQFSYKFEAVVVLAALLCWLHRRLPLAVLLLVCAGLSAPHTVASGGITAGVLGLLGLLRRDARQCRLAAAIIGSLLLAWAVGHFGFGVDLPKAEAAKFIDLQPAVLLRNLLHGLTDLLAGSLLGLLLLPGLVHCLRARDEPEIRLLGWLALSALIGAYFAYHLLLPDGDRSHFVTFAHALLVIPVGFWGLARFAAHHTGTLRYAALAALIASTGLGLYDLHAARDDGATTPCSLTDLARVQALLAGRPFGYFAAQDRNWWLSRHAFLAGLLDARAVRLNAIDSIDVKTQAARFYGSARPLQLVPPHPGEAPAQWSLRLAQTLGLHHLLEITPDTVPAELAATLRVELQAPGLRVFEVPAAGR